MTTDKNMVQIISEKKNVQVLIVDDIPQVRQGMATVLKLAAKNLQPAIEVIGEAKDGSEAVEQTKLLHPDVVLMDLEMPVLDGYAATQSIKSLDPTIGVVVLTIYIDDVSRVKANQAGADAFIEKGAPINDLIQAIHRFAKTS
jgi:DNA-binding NarL/FixJ family response regulator